MERHLIDDPDTGAPTPLRRVVDGRRRRALGVAVAMSIVLVIVIGAIFTMADAARAVSTDAAELHSLDLTARTVDEAAHQVAAALLLDGEPDQTAAAADARARALAALDDLSSVVGSEVVADLPELQPFIAAGRDSLEGDAVAADRFRQLTDSTRAAFAAEQNGLLEAIDDANDRLRRIGALGGFAVAVMVPLSAAYLYRQLAHRSDEAMELDASMRTRVASMTAADRRRLRTAAADRPDHDAVLAELRMDLELGLGRFIAEPSAVDIEEMAADFPLLRLHSEQPLPAAHADPVALQATFAAINELAALAGGRAVDLDATHADGQLTISSALDSGPPEPTTQARIAATSRVVHRAAAAAGWDSHISSDLQRVELRGPSASRVLAEESV